MPGDQHHLAGVFRLGEQRVGELFVLVVLELIVDLLPQRFGQRSDGLDRTIALLARLGGDQDLRLGKMLRNHLGQCGRPFSST